MKIVDKHYERYLLIVSQLIAYKHAHIHQNEGRGGISGNNNIFRSKFNRISKFIVNFLPNEKKFSLKNCAGVNHTQPITVSYVSVLQNLK